MALECRHPLGIDDTTGMAAADLDVIVVGAGISGLTAAKRLLSKDPSLQVLVLEGKGRVGGRTETVQLKVADGTDSFDLGGQWVGKCQHHIMALLEELGMEVHEQYTTGKKFLQVGDRITSYRSAIPSLSGFALLDLDRMFTTMDRYTAEVDVLDPYACPRAQEWDSQTVHSFIEEHARTKEAKEAIKIACRTVFGADVSQMSLLYFLTYGASGGGIQKHIQAIADTAQEYTIKGGAQQISQQLAAGLGGDLVHLEEPVVCIHQDDGKVYVTTAKGNTYTTQKLILAIPPPQIGKIHFEPHLPTVKKELIKRMPFGDLIKIIITYTTTFWRDAGSSGEVATNGGPSIAKGCDSGPVSAVFDETTSKGSPALVVFLGAYQAVQWRQQAQDVRQSAVLKSLAQFFGDKVYEFIEFVEKDWSSETYTEGSPVCTMGPGGMRYYAPGLRNPFGSVHFAGTESASIWCGYMSGAVQAGYRAAIEVLYDLRPQLVTPDDLAEKKTPEKPVVNSSVISKIKKLTIASGFLAVVIFSARKWGVKYLK